MKARVAVIGGGVAGLSAAYHLRERAVLTLFERGTYPGGHAHTVELDEQGTRLAVDTGFVKAEPHGVRVRTRSGHVESFDQVVIATHADEAEQLLEGYAERAHEFLRKVPYNEGRVVLHRDPSVMPKSRECWLSWNYGRVRWDGQLTSYIAYYLNRIHGAAAAHPFFALFE